MDYQYKKEINESGNMSWVFYRDEEPAISTENLAIAYFSDYINGRKLCSVCKHGDVENVQAWVARNEAKYKAENIPDELQMHSTIIYVNQDVDVDKVNRIINTSAIPESYFEALQYIDAEPIQGDLG